MNDLSFDLITEFNKESRIKESIRSHVFGHFIWRRQIHRKTSKQLQGIYRAILRIKTTNCSEFKTQVLPYVHSSTLDEITQLIAQAIVLY